MGIKKSILDIIGLDEFVIFSEPVILPPMVAFDMLVMLVSGVLMFCASERETMLSGY